MSNLTLLLANATGHDRFNVENDEEEDHLWFMGLPVPAAAAAIAGNAMAFYTLRLNSGHRFNTERPDLWIQYSLPVISIFISLLMVSRIPYPHAVSQLFRGRKSFTHIVVLMFCIFTIFRFPGYVIPAIAVLYAIIPPLIYAWKKVRGRKASRKPAT